MAESVTEVAVSQNSHNCAGNGGPRPGVKDRGEFRKWCRAVISDPKIRKALQKRAQEDTDFALKLAEHGFGRPGPQIVDDSDNNILLAGGPINISIGAVIPSVGLEDAPEDDAEPKP